MIGSDAESEGNVLRGFSLGGEAFGEVVVPGVEVIDPGFDGEAPGAKLIDGEGGAPPIVGKSRERGRLPFALRAVAIEEASGDVIVSIAEDGSGDLNDIAENALGWVAATIDAWLDLFDDDSFTAFRWFHVRCNSFTLSPPGVLGNGSRCGLC